MNDEGKEIWKGKQREKKKKEGTSIKEGGKYPRFSPTVQQSTSMDACMHSRFPSFLAPLFFLCRLCI